MSTNIPLTPPIPPIAPTSRERGLNELPGNASTPTPVKTDALIRLVTHRFNTNQHLEVLGNQGDKQLFALAAVQAEILAAVKGYLLQTLSGREALQKQKAQEDALAALSLQRHMRATGPFFVEESSQLHQDPDEDENEARDDEEEDDDQ